jgi:5'-deoxynucleotidase YfbR-like HD superfamily hydrolase
MDRVERSTCPLTLLRTLLLSDSDLPEALTTDVLLRAEKIAGKYKDRIKEAERAIWRDAEAAEEAAKEVESVLKRYKELVSNGEKIEFNDAERETYRKIMASSAPQIHTSKIDALIRATAENKVPLGRDSRYWKWIAQSP